MKHSTSENTHTVSIGLIAIAIVTAIVILLIDLSLPLGIAGGVPYVALVLLGWWFPRKEHVVYLAIIGTFLTFIGYWFSPEGGTLWVVETNRFLALFDIWITAALIIFVKQSEIDLLISKVEAERANNAKSDFLASMSHELRTPLNAILGFTQLLKIDRAHPLTVKQIESTEHILTAGDHLLSLINDVLDLAAIESGKIPLDTAPQDPTPIIKNCAVMARRLAAQKNLIFYDRTVGWILPEINIDETRFLQILLNLLSNAVKYNRSGGTVALAVEKGRNDSLRITVTDSGRGIASENHEQMFAPFSRLGLERSNITGTGIGLTITKKLVEGMGGMIGFESTLHVGSTFWLEFPIVGGELSLKDHGEAIASVTATSDTAPLSLFTVLCVEDIPSSLKLLESIIDRVPSATMIAAHTGELGVDMAEIHRPDMILMDINLPGMTGFETLDRLKASPTTKNIPVIALTARASSRDKARGLKAGFAEYLTKPIDINLITALITDAIQAKQAA